MILTDMETVLRRHCLATAGHKMCPSKSSSMPEVVHGAVLDWNQPVLPENGPECV